MQKIIAFLLGRTSTASIMGPFEKILTNLRAHQGNMEVEAKAHAAKIEQFVEKRFAALTEHDEAERAAQAIETMLGLRVAPTVAQVVASAKQVATAIPAEVEAARTTAATVAVTVQVDANKAIDTLKAVSTAASDAQAGLAGVASAAKVVANVVDPTVAPLVLVNTVGATGVAPAVVVGPIVAGLSDAAGCCPTGLVDGVCVTPGQPCGATGPIGTIGVTGATANGVTGTDAPSIGVTVAGAGTADLIANGGTITLPGATA